jgi:hypothetical protein
VRKTPITTNDFSPEAANSEEDVLQASHSVICESTAANYCLENEGGNSKRPSSDAILITEAGE